MGGVYCIIDETLYNRIKQFTRDKDEDINLTLQTVLGFAERDLNREINNRIKHNEGNKGAVPMYDCENDVILLDDPSEKEVKG